MDFEAQAKELVFKRELDTFCELLNRQKILFLIWKGSALAYTIYTDPLLRPRIDTDVLISPCDKAQVFDLLVSAGYCLQANQKDLLGQVSFSRQAGEVSLVYDVHWELFAQQSLKHLFTFEELWGKRQQITSVAAYTVCDEMALLLSSVHWVAHHYLYPKIQWISDIQLLTTDRNPEWWQTVKKLCAEKQICHLVHATLQAAQVASPWLNDEPQGCEPLQYLLAPQRNPWADFWQDWKVMSFQRRWVVLKKHLFPDSNYMRQKYALKTNSALSFYYTYRIFKGFIKLIKAN